MNESHLQQKKKKEIVPLVLRGEDLENQDEIDIGAISIETELASRYSEPMVKRFKRLAYELATVGLPLDDACLVVGLDEEKVRHLIDTDDAVKRLITLKDLEYKRGLLKVVSIKAKDDEKLSMWMLERRYPDEFNPKKGSGGGGEGGDNHIKTAITFIQMAGDKSPLVAKHNGKEYISAPRTDDEHKSVLKRIKDILA